MIRPDGIFPDPLCFRRLEGPEKTVGEGALDKFRGVSVADVVDEAAEAIVNGLCEEAIGRLGLKLCCNPCRSVVESDCLNIFGPINWPPEMSIPAVEKTPAPGNCGVLGRDGLGVGIGGGALCVLWSSVIMIELVMA